MRHLKNKRHFNDTTCCDHAVSHLDHSCKGADTLHATLCATSVWYQNHSVCLCTSDTVMHNAAGNVALCVCTKRFPPVCTYFVYFIPKRSCIFTIHLQNRQIP
jgi:hypothetical protein